MTLQTKNSLEYLRTLFAQKEKGVIYRLGKLFKTEQEHYFYDTGTGKVILLDSECYEIFNILFNKEISINFDEYISSLDKKAYMNILELIDNIKNENLLQAFPINRLYTSNHYENIEYMLNNQLYQVTLELTQRCNLRCGYCIYNENCESNRDFGVEDMSMEIAKSAIDYAKDHSGDEVAITFYGGEPLLKFDLIKWCVEYSQKVLSDKKLSFSMTTNLTLVTKKIAEYFSNIDNFNIVCSIDGPEEIQNSYRKYSNGKGTYIDAIRGLKYLADAFKNNNKNQLSINSVFGPPYTYEKINTINNFFKSLNWLPENISISVEYTLDGSVEDQEHIETLRNDPNYTSQGNQGVNPLWIWRKREFEDFVSTGVKNTTLNDRSFEQSLLKIHKRLLVDAPIDSYSFNACCVPGVRRLYVDTGGELYVCEKMGYSPSIGNSMTGINLDQVKNYYVKDYSDGSVESCSQCWAIRLCGVCYAGCYSSEGFNKNAKEALCSVEVLGLEMDLVLYHSILEKEPDKLEFLNKIEIY